MRKGGFNMYLQKPKKEQSLYQNYKPRFTKYQDAELSVYVSRTVGRSIARNMHKCVMQMSRMAGEALGERRD